MIDAIRLILTREGKLPVDPSTLSEAANLYHSGLTSHASVNVMLALEDEFGIEFPDELLRQSTFESIAAIRATLLSLGVSDDVSVAGGRAV